MLGGRNNFNKRGQVPTVLIFLAAILLAGLSLFALISFNDKFESQSTPLSEMMNEIEFNEQYILTQASLLLDESIETCFECTPAQLKSHFQDLALTKENQFLHEGAGNFYGRIRAGDFTLVENRLEIKDVFVQASRDNNKIIRSINIEIQKDL